MVDSYPMITGKVDENGDYEYNIPIGFVDGYQVHDAKTNEFLGWVDAKNHRIIKYTVKEIKYKEVD